MTQININFLPDEFPRSHEVFLVGGTVRDILLERMPLDYDMVTTGDPEALAKTLAAAFKTRFIRLGKPGVFLYRINTPDFLIDITSAAGNAIETDLRRRDFTINAMAIRTSNGELLDLFNGRFDIDHQCIRMIAPENLLDDPIRMLRAFRFGAKLKFSIHADTRQIINQHAQKVQKSAPERLREELFKLLESPSSYPYLNEMRQTGMITAILPEMIPLKGCRQNKHHADDVFSHSFRTVESLEKILNHPQEWFRDIQDALDLHAFLRHTALLKFSALIHDIGKPWVRTLDENGEIHFYQHEKISAALSDNITRRLCFSNPHRQYVHHIIAHHMKPLMLFLGHQKGRLTPKGIARFFIQSRPHAEQILTHAGADMLAKGTHPDMDAFFRFIAGLMKTYHHEFKPMSKQPPLLTGKDLIHEFHLSPSPIFSKILRHIEELRLCGQIATRNDALNAVKIFLNSNPHS